MPYSILIFSLFLFFSSLNANPLFEATKDLPVTYQGRFRSIDSASRLWLYEIYHKQQLKTNDLPAFHARDTSSIDLLWQIHFFGHARWDNAPFFWVHYASIKSLLNIESARDRFSFNQLYSKLHESNLFADAVSNSAEDKELKNILHQFNTFEEYEGTSNQNQMNFENFYHDLKEKMTPSNEMAYLLESRFPFIYRLQASGTTLKMLPAKFAPGEWVSLHAFKIKIYDQKQNQLILSNNFTSFSQDHFLKLRNAYFELENQVLSQSSPEEITSAANNFADQYKIAYQSIAGKPYKQALNKTLTYPTERRLQAETLYYRLPLIETTLIAYALALILMIYHALEYKKDSNVVKNLKLEKLSLLAVLVGFSVNTAVLAFRCWILQRPPVSNMFETVVYVPWIAVAIGLIFYIMGRSQLIISAAVIASFALLILLRLTQSDPKLENVQAVLDSQYWLIIHVLMVVGSYGAFAVCGILGHFYLIDYAIKRKENPTSEKIAHGILHTMYAGVALLIPGTILGGVWAAESWGRFWDWDPKESWAFISACVYVLFIHAYTFHYLREFGLAIGAITGLIAISFTWYGVNYILGTGLHSYGFGDGGVFFYFFYVAIECLFIFLMVLWHRSNKKQISPSKN